MRGEQLRGKITNAKDAKISPSLPVGQASRLSTKIGSINRTRKQKFLLPFPRKRESRERATI